MRLWLHVAAINALFVASTALHSNAALSTDVKSLMAISGRSLTTVVERDSCWGLPRNTVLASCPAPCLPDTPCVVYDQDAAHSKLTGCDFSTGDPNSFCWSEPSQTCEFHCFARYMVSSVFLFSVAANASALPPPSPRAPTDPSLIESAFTAYQSNDFVTSVGKLDLSENILDVQVRGERSVQVNVDPAMLSLAPSVTSLTLSDLPLGDDLAAAIIASAARNMKKLAFVNAQLTERSWTMFSSIQTLEILKLDGNAIPRVLSNGLSMPALKQISLQSTNLTSFEVRAPSLTKLELQSNKLVSIPQSVFTYTRLAVLDVGKNPIVRPLVLTAQQVQFLEALPTLFIQLVDPPDQSMVTRLPSTDDSEYGEYSDDVDLSSFLTEATEKLLRGNKLLPVRVVDSEKATAYNNLLDLRARNRVGKSSATKESCMNLPRNTLLSSCPAPCRPDKPCMVYEQDADHTKLTGCDYDTSSRSSFCSSKPKETCEFHCFTKYTPIEEFAFHVDYKPPSLRQTPRTVDDPKTIDRRETSYQSNDFVVSVGTLNVSKSISRIHIAGEWNMANEFVSVDVEPAFLSRAPSVTSLTLRHLPLGNSRAAAIVAAASSNLTVLDLMRTNFTSPSWTMFASMPMLELLSLKNNGISFITGNESTMPALKTLDLSENKLDGFDIRAPKLTTLDLTHNQLVRIPECIFSSTALETLFLSGNPIIRPLVLTERQLQFLVAFATNHLTLGLVDPPDNFILARLPVSGGNYGDYYDDKDLSVLVKGAKETMLWNNPLISVRVVDSETAAVYNNLLEMRARFRGKAPSLVGSEELIDIPVDMCQGVPRNTLLSNDLCPINGACVAYDQDRGRNLPSGCDYDVASQSSACALSRGEAGTCEFHCFGVYEPESQFKFFIPFQTELGPKITRQQLTREGVQLKKEEVPYLSNAFVNQIGPLVLPSIVTEVLIAGGRSEKGSPGRTADVVVSPSLLRKSPGVISLVLMNIDIRRSNLTAVLMSAQPVLKTLELRNMNIETVPDGIFTYLHELVTLTLAQNSITVFDVKPKTPSKLKTLDLSENAMMTFEFEAPDLRTLDMSTNNLVRIPPSVFALKELVTLDLQCNPFELPLVLSPSEYAFLSSLSELRLTLPDTESPGCSSPQFEVVFDGGKPSEMPQGTDPVDDGALPVSPIGAGRIPPGSSMLLDNSSVAGVLKGLPVIIVVQHIADQYNNQLEQQYRESMTTHRPRATSGDNDAADGVGSTPTTSTSADSLGSSREQVSSTDTLYSASSPTPSLAVGADPRPIQDTNSTPSSKSDNPAAEERGGVSVLTKLMLGGLGSTFVLAVFLFVYITRKRRSNAAKKPSNYLAMTDPLDQDASTASYPGGGALTSWWNDDIILSHRLNARDISDVRVISSGSSSISWLVNYRGGTRKLLSKRLVQGEGTAHDAKVLQLVAQAKISSTLRYRSIVSFVGVAWTDTTDVQVLYEYMSRGDLGSFLACTEVSTLSWQSHKLQLAIDTIEALVYIHSFDPPLLHRDLKASNVLLCEDLKAKLANFSHAMFESETSKQVDEGAGAVGAARWMAPELLSERTCYGVPTDIYAFGVVLCELDTHQIPYTQEAIGTDDTELLQRVARGDLRPTLSASCPPEIREIANACFSFDPAERPNAMQIAHTLRSLRARSTDS